MHEILVPHRVEAPRVTHVRSTLLQSSLANLRRSGYFERWRSTIGDHHGRELEELIAPTWVDVELALAHYHACDALGLQSAQIEAIGQSVGDHIQNTLVSLSGRTARAAGLDPKTVVPVFDKLFGRIFRGGSVSIVQTGPKDLQVELRGLRVSASYYFRTAYIGHLRAAARFVGVRAFYAKQARFDQKLDSFVVSVAWV